MEKPLTPKQEAFCHAFIETSNASEAYRRAYNAGKMKASTINRMAHDVLENRNVAARLEELRASHCERHNVTVDDLIAELDEARKAALSADSPQAAAAISATMGKAKLLGLDEAIKEKRKEIHAEAKSKITAKIGKRYLSGKLTYIEALAECEVEGVNPHVTWKKRELEHITQRKRNKEITASEAVEDAQIAGLTVPPTWIAEANKENSILAGDIFEPVDIRLIDLEGEDGEENA